MPPAGNKEAVVLILDVRKDASQQSSADAAFNKVKECAKKIVLRKVLSASKDHIALILVGTETTNNVIEDDISYDNISVIRNLQLATWEMVEDILEEMQAPTGCGGDILESIVVALSILRNTEPKEYSGLKIVLLSNANGKVNPDGLDVILAEMKRMGVQVTVIGPTIAEHSQSQDMSDAEMKDLPPEQALVVRLADETDGLLCRFGDALGQLAKFERKKVKAAPWKVTLDVGPDIKIPVIGVIKTTPAEDIKAKVERICESDGAPVAQDYVFTATTATSADPEPIEKGEIIDGYNFGATIVPFSEDEKAALKYESGPRAFSILFFTHPKNLPRHLYIGNGSYHFFSVDEPRAKTAFISLIEAMEEENVVAIVRRIYNNNNAPSIGMLAPKAKKKYKCLEYVALPFADDVKHFVFAPLASKKLQPSAAQLDAVDQLITTMNLMEVADEYEEFGEAFRSKDTVDPVQQHLYEAICDRALRPSKEMFKPSETVLKMLAPPPDVEERSRPILDKIKNLFTLAEVTPKEGSRKAAADVFKQESIEPAKIGSELQVPGTVKVEQPLKVIGTLTPVEDFARMLDEKHIPFGEVCAQTQTMIWKCVESAFDLEDMKKTVLSVRALRSACVKAFPSTYNSWVAKLKVDLPPTKRAFWKLVVEDGLTLITSEESELSAVSRKEAEDLIRDEPAPMEEERDGDDSLDDLVNDM